MRFGKWRIYGFIIECIQKIEYNWLLRTVIVLLNKKYYDKNHTHVYARMCV